MILGFQIKRLGGRDSIYGKGDDLQMCPVGEESQIYSD